MTPEQQQEAMVTWHNINCISSVSDIITQLNIEINNLGMPEDEDGMEERNRQASIMFANAFRMINQIMVSPIQPIDAEKNDMIAH